MCIVGPSLHKAGKADRFRGETWKDVKGVSRNNTRELRYKGRGRWGCIPSLRGTKGRSRSERKSGGRVRT
jgi:hypothetical protein